MAQKPTDNPRAEAAFSFFASLPTETRSYGEVAKKFGVGIATVKRWGATGQWRRRLNERQARIARQAADRVEATEVDARSRRTKLVELGLIKLANAIAKGDVRPSYGDLDRLVRLEGHLTGTDKTLPLDEVDRLFQLFLRAIEQEIHDPEQRRRIAEAIRDALDAAQAAS